MELDELKILLNDKMQQAPATKSALEINMLLDRRTQSVMSKIKRSLILELITTVIFMIMCALVAAYGSYDSIRIYFGIFAFVCALFIPLLYALLKKTQKLGNADLPVKDNLQSVIRLVKDYIKRYFQLTIALIPVSLITAFVLGYNDASLNSVNSSNPFVPNFIGSTLKISLLSIYVVLFSVGMYYFTKWYLKKLYGNYVQQLESVVEELDEQK